MLYYKNATGTVGEYASAQSGLTEATSGERDSYLLAKAKAEKASELDAAYDGALSQNVSYGGNTFQSGERTRTNLVEAVVRYGYLAEALPANFTWRDSSNNDVAFVYNDIVGLAAAVGLQKEAAIATLKAKKNAVIAAATVAEVDAITWG